MEERAARVAQNEALFRSVNETVLSMGRGGISPFVIACECGDSECGERLGVSREAYEAARSEPTHFILKSGHDNPEVEIVVDEPAVGIAIVRKIGVGAAIAAETDPRS